MSTSLEHDYIGLSEMPTMDASEKISLTDHEDVKVTGGGLKYKETELRLGLPGSESPERKVELNFLLCGAGGKIFPLGVKRGFSDAIDGPGKWVLSGPGPSEVGTAKGAASVFLTRGGKDMSVQQSSSVIAALAAKEVVKPSSQENKAQISTATDHGAAPAAKAQVVGWPPIRSFRRNSMASNTVIKSDEADSMFVKVSMDGAPYLRKVDLKTCANYKDLSSSLENMFSCFTLGQCGSHGVPSRDGLNESRLRDLLHGSEYVLSYEDKDRDLMLVGDVPWEMFTGSCKRLRIMKGKEAIGLGFCTFVKTHTICTCL